MPVDVVGLGEKLEPQSAAALLLKIFRIRWAQKRDHNRALTVLLQARALDPYNREVVAALDEVRTFFVGRARSFAEEMRNPSAALFAAGQALRIAPNDGEMLAIVRTVEERYPHLKTAPKAEAAPVAPPIILPPLSPPPTPPLSSPPQRAESPAHRRARLRTLIAGAEGLIERGELEVAQRNLAAVLKEDPGNRAACRLIVEIYRQQTGQQGPLNFQDLGRPLTDQEKMVQAALAVLDTKLQAAPKPPLVRRPPRPRPALPPEEAAIPSLPVEAEIGPLSGRVQRGALFAEARVLFGEEKYAEAAERFSALLQIAPLHLGALCYHHLSVLRRDFPFLTGAEAPLWEPWEQKLVKNVAERLWQRMPAAVAGGSRGGYATKDRIDEEFEAVASLSAVEARAQKKECLDRARNAFGSHAYAQAAEAFAAALQVDPRDMKVFCFERLSVLKRDFPYLAGAEPSTWEEVPVREIAERLEQRIEAIEFFRERPFMFRDELKAEAEEDPRCRRILGLVDRQASNPVFARFSEAGVASGVRNDPAVLKSVREKIEEEFQVSASALKPEVLVKKRKLLEQAVVLFEQEDYTKAAGAFAVVLEIHPDDMRALCYSYLIRLKQKLALLPEKLKEGRNYQEILQESDRLSRRIAVIEFLRGHRFEILERIYALDPTIYNLIEGSSRVFCYFRGARVAAGIVTDLAALTKIKSELEEKFQAVDGQLRMLLDGAQRKKRSLLSKAEGHLAKGHCARAAALFAEMVEVFPENPQVLSYYYSALLKRDFGFLTALDPGLNVGLLDPQVFSAVQKKGNKERVVTEFEAARAALEPAWQAAQTEKAKLFPAAEAKYLVQEYQASADLFRKLLVEADPNDIQARCFYYLSLMHLRYAFLSQSGADYARYGKAQYVPKVKAARRLWQRIKLIGFLIEHKDDKPALTNVPAVRGVAPAMASLVGGGPDFKIFSGVEEARVAAGLEFDPVLLEEKIKPDIDREAARFGIEPLSC